MSLYKEGYNIVCDLIKRQVQIYPDAADYGVPVNKDDKNWKKGAAAC